MMLDRLPSGRGIRTGIQIQEQHYLHESDSAGASTSILPLAARFPRRGKSINSRTFKFAAAVGTKIRSSLQASNWSSDKVKGRHFLYCN